MNNYSALAIRQETNDYFSKKLVSMGIPVFPAFLFGSNFLLRIIRRAWLKWKLPLSYLWYNPKLKSIETKTILVFDAQLTPDFVEWLRKNNPTNRIVFIYMNIVRAASVNPISIENFCERWTFDRKDAERYSLFYNPGVYSVDWAEEKKDKEYDIVFVGRDKGRYNQLMTLKRKFEALGIKTYFHIVADHSYQNWRRNYKPLIPYAEIPRIVARSFAVLDFIQDGQVGADMRVFEALFSRTKIITNNKCIDRYDFYRKENIFILGVDNFAKLRDFLFSPYFSLDTKILYYYEFNSWLKRVLEVSPCNI